MEVSYENLMGGDGMQIQIDKRNPNIVFTGFSLEIIIESIVPQTNASTFRQSQKKMKTTVSIGKHLLLSSHNQDILYMGSNFTSFHESRQTWTAISPDLTNGTKEGNVAWNHCHNKRKPTAILFAVHW
jgi:hypothetical protein